MLPSAALGTVHQAAGFVVLDTNQLVVAGFVDSDTQVVRGLVVLDMNQLVVAGLVDSNTQVVGVLDDLVVGVLADSTVAQFDSFASEPPVERLPLPACVV